MNRSEAQAILPVLTAFAEGKEVQVMGNLGGWFDASVIDPYAVTRYRVKPTPVLRPWTVDEMPRFLMTKSKHAVGRQATLGVTRTFDPVSDPAFMLANFIHVHEDGTESPCGVMRNES